MIISIRTTAHWAVWIGLATLAGEARAQSARPTETGTTSDVRREDLRYFDADARPEFEAREAKKATGDGSRNRTAGRRALPPGVEEISILGQDDQAFRAPGSVYQLDSEFLNRAEIDDVHQALANVPGVYVRDEDGFGLRPNIGMRGAWSDRSSKITLLEDGVLLGPAPYSAPAAYYFPLFTRIHGVTVTKGPAAISTGPQTVAGSVDLATQPVPEDGPAAYVDAAGGSFGTVKLHGYGGFGAERWGVLVEGAHLRTNGFKDIVDGDGDDADPLDDRNTGFQRTDVMVKGLLRSDPDRSAVHSLELKGGFQAEVSNETYLGLAEDDFATAPFSRYEASQEDQMDWERTQVQLRWTLKAPAFDVNVTAYRHDFQRVWRRFQGFGPGGPVVANVLRNPNASDNALFVAVLEGAQDSEGQRQEIRITNNDRSFVSQGIQARAEIDFDTGPANHTTEVGARIHHDRIDRDHTEDPFIISGGELTPAAGPRVSTTDNFDSTIAGAAYLRHTLRWSGLTLSPGIRVEAFEIRRRLEDAPDRPELSSTQAVWLPGVGASYEILPGFLALAGVYRGFSPPPPGLLTPSTASGEQEPMGEPEPETSWNSELGLRLRTDVLWMEAIGFFNRYENFVGLDTASSGGDLSGAARSLGGADVAGIEAALQTGFEGPWNLRFGLSANYTYTHTAFLEDIPFGAFNPRFNGAQAGDPIPYVPEHLGAVRGTIDHPDWGGLTLGARGQADTLDRVAVDPGDPTAFNDGYAVVDLTARFFATDWLTVYTRIDNLFDDTYLVSRLPFGARPGRPFTALVGVKLRAEPPRD